MLDWRKSALRLRRFSSRDVRDTGADGPVHDQTDKVIVIR
jgi:hypothetical protein